MEKLDSFIYHCFEKAAEAEDRIDNFLKTQNKEEEDKAQRAQVDQGYNFESFYILHFSLRLDVAL